MVICKMRVDFQCLSQLGNGLVHQTFLEQSCAEVVAGIRNNSRAEVVVGICGVGVGCQCLSQLGNGLVHRSFLEQSHAEVVVGICKVRVDFQCLPQLNHSVVHHPFLAKSIAEVVVDIFIIRIDCQRLLQLSDSLVHRSFLEQSRAEVVVGHETAGVSGNGHPPERFNVVIHSTLPPGQHAEGQQQRSTKCPFQGQPPLCDEFERPVNSHCRHRHHTHAPEILPVV